MDRIEFQDAVTDYANDVFKIAFAYCKSRQDAEDIVQNTFLKLLRHSGDFENDEHLKRWLLKVAVNEAKSMHVSFWKRRTVPLEASALDSKITFDTLEQSNLYDAVMKLGEKYSVVIHLYYYEGYSTKEIAKILRITETAVQTRVMRARKKLKALMTMKGV